MEVVVGSIGIASSAIQVADSALKLKSFWDSVREAPEDIKFIIEEIETLSNILSEIDIQNREHQIPLIDNGSAVKCLQLCQQGMNILLDVVKDLDQDIAKRKHWGTIKVALKKDSLARHRARLESAKTMLSLSNQVYFTALQRQTLALQRQSLRQHVQNMGEIKTILSGASQVTVLSQSLTAEESKDKTSTDQCASKTAYNATRTSSYGSWKSSASWLEYFLGSIYYRRTTKTVSKDNYEEVEVRFRIPAWLVNKAWEARSTKARSGWTIRLQTYNIVPANSKIFTYAYQGNVEDLRVLLERNEASPFDRDDQDGMTALHFAAYMGHLETCRLLINQGADGRAKASGWGSHPLNYLGQYAHRWTSGADRTHLMELFKLFIVECENDVLADDDNDPRAPLRALFAGPPEAMILMQQRLYPPYSEKPLFERVAFALDLEYRPWCGNVPDVFRTAISRGPIEASAYHVRNAYGETILAWIAGALGACISQSRNTDLVGWRTLLRECVMAEVDLCAVTTLENVNGQTPLTRFIQEFVEDNTRIRALSLDIGHIVRFWAEELSNAGADLLQYGQQEKQLHDTDWVSRSFDLYIGIDRGGERHFKGDGEWRPWRLISFTYGPSPSDWQAWGSNPRDEFAGEFWRMIEHLMQSEVRIPGS